MVSARRLARRYAHPLGLGLVVAGLLFFAYLFLVTTPTTQTFGYDAFAYWSVTLPNPYTIEYGAVGSFNYSPPVALIASLFDSVEWWVFLWVWTLVLVGTIVWIAGGPSWILVAFSIPFVAIELYHGNIHILLAAAIVLGFKHPWTWAFVLLTKPTAGVGLLWFAVRREWRELGIALGTTIAICAVSLLIMPSLWRDYVDVIITNMGNVPSTVNIDIPLWIRLPLAAALVTWGALTDRRWTVVISAMLALPVLWLGAGAMLIGLIPEFRQARSSRVAAGAQADSGSEVPADDA